MLRRRFATRFNATIDVPCTTDQLARASSVIDRIRLVARRSVRNCRNHCRHSSACARHFRHIEVLLIGYFEQIGNQFVWYIRCAPRVGKFCKRSLTLEEKSGGAVVDHHRGHIKLVFGIDGVTSIFRPLAQPAQEIKETSILVLAVCTVIFIVVAGLLVYGLIRFRHRAGDEASEPPQVYGSNQIELAWTVLPILIVFVLILVTSRTIADIQNRKPPPGAVQATVVGHQWWWEIRYPELGIVTANELHVPASTGNSHQPTFLKLQSADVAHSFWVPQLAGKTDLIPNRENLDVDRANYPGHVSWQLRRVLRHTARPDVDSRRCAFAGRV